MPAKSKKQARFMRLVRKCQITGKCLSDDIKKAAESMTDKQAHYFASTTDAEIEGNRQKKESFSFKDFLFFVENKKTCTCPCKECKENNNCSKCMHENCKYEGCNCH
jgi:hypothetical protein